MNKRLRQLFEECRGEGYVDVVVLILCTVLVLALALRVLPVFIQKQQLDLFATELVREAEISGRIGSETDRRAAVLTEIGLFGEFASFPITLRAQATGKSEVYWK